MEPGQLGAASIPRATYILPLRWTNDAGLEELVEYLESLESLSELLRVMVVDGSSPVLFQTHARAFPAAVLHVVPDVRPGGNGKVAGVMTGVAFADTELLILADDDVRYTTPSLHAVLGLLQYADVVRPQNYFLALPWHARWDTARTLINRAFAADYPGTFAVRRSALLATGGYDGDVLFENLELLRTIRAAGGREVRAPDVLVGRLPPSVQQFLNQRVRQAYDNFAQPGRLFLELLLLPLLVVAVYRAVLLKRPRLFTTLVTGSYLAAETGRRRHGGRDFFPPNTAFWAPVWVLERSICVWIAVVRRQNGGIPYAGSRLLRAATSERELRNRHADKITTRRSTHVQ